MFVEGLRLLVRTVLPAVLGLTIASILSLIISLLATGGGIELISRLDHLLF